jgi:hypothetical protein
MSTLAMTFAAVKIGFHMALMTAYFDESGIHEGDHYCVVAGFVGNDAQWQALAADWIPAIKPRNNLHMTELRWNQHPERIAPLLAKTGPIPGKYNLTPVAIGLKWQDYNAIAKGKIREKFTNPYMMCAHCAMATVLYEVIGSDDIYFLFDRQEGLRKETMHTLRDFVFDRVGVDSRIKGLDFIPRKSTVCLDPADYLAFMIREQAMDGNSVKVKMGESILERKPFGGPIRAEQLQWIVDNLIADGFVPDSPLPPFPEKAVRELMAMNPYWRGPKSV